jgi:ABC-type uncharacterized transport system substrate-binding protein
MRRRAFLAVMAAPLVAEAQQAGKVYRIGVLSLWPPSTYARQLDAFRAGMREVGYVEGRDYVFDIRNAGGKQEQLHEIARTLAASRVDIILVGAGATLSAAAAATQTIPIVIASTTADPVRRGLAKSLARPQGNVTGVTGADLEGLNGKRVELVKQMVPNLSRIFVVMNPTSQRDSAQEVEVVAKTLGLAFIAIPITASEEIDAALAKLPARHGDGLIVFSESPLWPHRARIAELVAGKKLPALYTLREYAEAGGLMSYAASFEDAFRRSAGYVDKIFRGAKPGDLPIERPSKWELVINLKTARTLGLTIPPPLLLRADQVIE